VRHEKIGRRLLACGSFVRARCERWRANMYQDFPIVNQAGSIQVGVVFCNGVWIAEHFVDGKTEPSIGVIGQIQFVLEEQPNLRVRMVRPVSSGHQAAHWFGSNWVSGEGPLAPSSKSGPMWRHG
jgi:hypothetical protein